MTSSFSALDEASTITETVVEISSKRDWLKVPALNVNGTAIVVDGNRIRVARVLDEEWLEDELQSPALCTQALEQKSISKALRADLFTFSQKLPATTPKYSFPLEWDSIAAIHITSYKDWWENLPQESRKNVRRSQKRGVEVTVRKFDDDLVRDIVELTKDSPIRQGKPFTHYDKTFEQVKKDQSSHLDRSEFICAYHGNELVGLLKVVYARDCASILQFIPKSSQQDKRPANALIAKAVQTCDAKGIRYLIYGMFRYGKKRQSSLVEFKIRNGFEEFLVPRFYIPLTAWGAFCLKFRLHRGLIGALPDSVIRAGLHLRAAWYNFARFSSRCSSMVEQPNRIRQMDGSTPPAGSKSKVSDV